MSGDFIDQARILQEFDRYSGAYDASDPKIKLKIDHTYRVAEFCREIAQSLALPKQDAELAWVCGMLHDIGRFEQVVRYGTFIDAQSVDHAQFGADLLFREGLIRRFFSLSDDVAENLLARANSIEQDSLVTTSWAEQEELCDALHLIEQAIRAHNQFRIPEHIQDEKILVVANILRDADKIDILRVNCETPIEDIYNVTTEELRNALVSEDVKQAFRERRCSKRRPGMTAADAVVGHVNLTFELVYPRSRELVYEQGYLRQILQFQSDAPETREWFAYMTRELFGKE